MYPFNIDVAESVVNLFKLDDGRYQQIKAGSIGILMIGYKYVLVENKLAEYLMSLDIERVTYKNAIIWDRSSNIEHTNYQQLMVNQHFEPDQLDDLCIDGMRFLIMDNRYLFVSPDLKKRLAKSEFKFIFSEGLSQFG